MNKRTSSISILKTIQNEQVLNPFIRNLSRFGGIRSSKAQDTSKFNFKMDSTFSKDSFEDPKVNVPMIFKRNRQNSLSTNNKDKKYINFNDFKKDQQYQYISNEKESVKFIESVIDQSSNRNQNVSFKSTATEELELSQSFEKPQSIQLKECSSHTESIDEINQTKTIKIKDILKNQDSIQTHLTSFSGNLDFHNLQKFFIAIGKVCYNIFSNNEQTYKESIQKTIDNTQDMEQIKQYILKEKEQLKLSCTDTFIKFQDILENINNQKLTIQQKNNLYQQDQSRTRSLKNNCFSFKISKSNVQSQEVEELEGFVNQNNQIIQSLNNDAEHFNLKKLMFSQQMNKHVNNLIDNSGQLEALNQKKQNIIEQQEKLFVLQCQTEQEINIAVNNNNQQNQNILNKKFQVFQDYLLKLNYLIEFQYQGVQIKQHIKNEQDQIQRVEMLLREGQFERDYQKIEQRSKELNELQQNYKLLVSEHDSLQQIIQKQQNVTSNVYQTFKN